MKRILALLIAVLVFTTFTACAGKTIDMSVNEISDALFEGTSFQEIPTKNDNAEFAIGVLNVDKSLVAIDDSVYQASIALSVSTPELVIVIEAVDKKAAKTINKTSIQAYIDYLHDGYSDYGPAQVPKIEKCVRKVVGCHVIVVISADYKAAGGTLDGLLK